MELWKEKGWLAQGIGGVFWAALGWWGVKKGVAQEVGGQGREQSIKSGRDYLLPLLTKINLSPFSCNS